MLDTGGSEKQANKLTKQMNSGLKKAKSDLAEQDEYDGKSELIDKCMHLL